MVATAAGTFVALLARVALVGILVPPKVALAGATLVAIGVAWLVYREFSPALRGLARRNASICALWLLMTAFGLWRFADETVFIVDPSSANEARSALPTAFWSHHSCASAYYEAIELTRAKRNLYDESIYYPPRTPSADNPLPFHVRYLGQFALDAYEYPPTFLPLPWTLRFLARDYLSFNQLWFALSSGVVFLAVISLARWSFKESPVAPIIAATAMFCSYSTRLALQMGNFQLPAVALTVLAMLAFAKGRRLFGGVLLGYVISAKLFPGILLIYLIRKRQWRELAYTTAAIIGSTLLSLAIFGTSPFAYFVSYHVPRLANGNAFRFALDGEWTGWTVAMNYSVSGLVLKLKLLGVSGATFRTSSIVGWAYTAALLGASWSLAGRPVEPRDKAAMWLALLGLATFRSPFLPQEYGVFVPAWLFIHFVLSDRPKRWLLCTFFGLWLVLSVPVPAGPEGVGVVLVSAKATMALMIFPWSLSMLLFMRAMLTARDERGSLRSNGVNSAR